jgi:hypothetical protein
MWQTDKMRLFGKEEQREYKGNSKGDKAVRRYIENKPETGILIFKLWCRFVIMADNLLE